ncbi:hypothetical protein [Hymenobacter rigui]|uniref:Lipoprotein n=1 Tax=Hymenobacter rigui TaxID=334424 RepID=A0A3R9MSX3_9BACT|nr:hypothetical protein [Hymenobacter rigui]RSK49282.1 hypothetical protein EI291_07210 [Hymenobacter rigui]
MKNTLRYLTLACLLTTALSGCGSKDKAEETTATTTTETSATTTAPATATPAEEAPATSAPAAAFDINTVPVSSANLGQFPYLSALKGYEVNTSNSEDYDFERAYVFDGKSLIPIEGKVSQRLFDEMNGEKKASELMIQRNYETLLKGLGAVQVFSGKVTQEAIDKVGSDEVYKHNKWSLSPDHETSTYVIRQKDKEVWALVTPLGGDGNYNITMIERAAMPQQATIIKADELKKN